VRIRAERGSGSRRRIRVCSYGQAVRKNCIYGNAGSPGEASRDLPNHIGRKTDRLYRNLKDWTILDDLSATIHLVNEGRIGPTSRSSDQLAPRLNVLMVCHYVLNLGEETCKGRMRDKLCAAWRRGKWIGEWPVLGYDMDPKGGRLVMNANQAAQVREMYESAASREFLESALRDI
jgi:site-specific DNA recombinase